MLRGGADAILLFLLPFLAYGLLLILQRRTHVFGTQLAGGRLGLLALIGLGLVLLGLILVALFAPRRGGAYVPAHIDGGRLVPGRIQ